MSAPFRPATTPGAEPGVIRATPAPGPARVAVLGDVGGHTHALRRVLESLGVGFDLGPREQVAHHDWARVDLAWPEDLTVVQVGDLVHRGPDSPGVLVLVDRLLREGRWRQVVGNHEQLYVGLRTFHWPEHLDDASVDLLRAWWGEGLMRPAVAITGPGAPAGGALVTHAGLTAGFWHRLGRPGDATAAAATLNELTDHDALWTPGAMLGLLPSPYAGPVWAEAGRELYHSWVAGLAEGIEAPCSQVHGHSTAFSWTRHVWQAPDPVRPHLKADTSRRHVTATIGPAELVGVDPCHSTVRSRVWAPKLFTDATA